MKHLSLSEFQRSTNDIPDGEIFAVHDLRQKTSTVLYMPSGMQEEFWCLAIRIKGQVFQSDWVREDAPKEAAKNAMKQILSIKRGGWFQTGETRLDDELKLHRMPVYRCAYCKADTTEPRGACICRRLALAEHA